jgi:homoserine dehydrogenase
MKEKIGISMLGCGTVGLPLFRMLSVPGLGIEVRKVLAINPENPMYDDVRKVAGTQLIDGNQFDATQGRIITEDLGTDIVIEVIGGSINKEGKNPYEKTRDTLLTVLRGGKHVITANKTVISYWGPELFDAADQAGVNILFEAAVAGSIPIIRLLRSYWRHQPIRKIAGILNGTSNFVLSRMSGFRDPNAPMPFLKAKNRVAQRSDYLSEKNGAMLWALDHARAAGLAEANPSFDVDGHDAAQKLSILASLAFNVRIAPIEDNIPRSSILPVTLEDIELADKLGFVIKPMAVAERHGDSVNLRVHPCLLSKSHPLANVSGAYNAIYLESDTIEGPAGRATGFGKHLYYGQGAGGDPTATALFSDVIEMTQRIKARIVDNPSYHRSDKRLSILPGQEQVSPGYIKSVSKDVPGVFMRKTQILYGDGDTDRINIHQIYNLHEFTRGDLVPDVITIMPTKYRNVERALKRLVDEGVAEEPPLFLRIEE